MKQGIIHWLIRLVLIVVCMGYLRSDLWAVELCAEWAGKVVSVQGTVEARKAGDKLWLKVKLNDTYHPGDRVRVQENSRAAVALCNDALLRLDQKTTITFSAFKKEKPFLLDLLSGAVHFFSRFPKRLQVKTPFVNAAVEGTEFLVRVETDKTILTILEGQVAAANDAGSLVLAGGESAVVYPGQAPSPRVAVRPRDAVDWALYYPPIIDWRSDDFQGGDEGDWRTLVRRSVDFYWEGDMAAAFSSLQEAPENIRDPRFFNYRAALLLSVGRVDEARANIEKALTLDSASSHAYALDAIMDVVQNQKDKALATAQKAVELDPNSATARVALSYVRQAQFDLSRALHNLKEAVELNPENALVWARLAELLLSVGQLDKASRAARKAVDLNPNIARTRTVLGFALITRIKIKDSIKTFQKAIVLDSAAPLPRLGLGLAMIRQGDLQAGRAEIEIAASLDPNNSLIRSYLGKAYYEEKRDKLAADQFEIAKKLDPQDPTPHFYDAIRKQTENRPVEALHDLQKSIELNDNRAVYRSRLQLDQDLAARSASLGRIYSDLGFQQLALVEGWKSVNTDPANYSAHRFLADSYSVLPRHEIARVSELLQSQLLQPINITPVQPRLAETNLFILDGAGPADPGFNEFNPLFLRNRFALQASGIVGGNDTRGYEVVQSGVWNRFSYSLGGLDYETDGFRENNDQERGLYNAFAQVSLTYKTSIQGEVRYKDLENGDLDLRFDPTNFSKNLRQEEKIRSARFGFRHGLSSNSDIIGSVIYSNGEADTDATASTTVPLPPPFPPIQVPAQIDTDIGADEEGYLSEFRHLFHSKMINVSSGVGHYEADRELVTNATTVLTLPFPPFSLTIPQTTPTESDISHTNLYTYSLIRYPENFIWTIGASADLLEGAIVDTDQFNPKLGITWNPILGTTFRGAVFKTLKRNLISSQTLEPTQVAGFNQFFDDTEGVDAWRYGLAVDQKISQSLYTGAELSRRELEVPYLAGVQLQQREVDWEERFGRAYLYWTPHKWIAGSVEYQYDRFEREREFPGKEFISLLKTHRLPIALSFFHPSGLGAQIKSTYIDQEGEFFDQSLTNTFEDSDDFWVVDASIGYRFPKRWGIITVGILNLFDKEFNFQDTDPANPTIYPERFVFGKFTLAF